MTESASRAAVSVASTTRREALAPYLGERDSLFTGSGLGATASLVGKFERRV
ncbi:MAG: hypothetical protein QM765_43330 [Myxococcales bacterium]